ncbi:glucose-1-phosphate thymidylyltransferase [Sulfodiicoccus acidiphilus]|nr:glucose-1-phosphate thymidylyltransferase [Sulfodiicoccus acidiphilus]GGT92914.1 glucose-1-phosphate thymidylyltransferase [Sulfodiicoccus acidiphilus]
MEAVILHGGQGTRLRPLTHTGPKQLIRVAGKPVSQWVLEQVVEAGITDVVLVLGDNNPTRVVEYYGDGSKFGARIRYVYQGKARGLADAVYRVRKLVSDQFLVYLGDNVVPYDLRRLFPLRGAASILLARVPNPGRFGVVVVRDGKVVRLVEKPKEPVSDLALVGVYGFTSEVFEVVQSLRPSWRGELEITDAIQGLVDRGREVEFQVVDGWWKDTGTPEDVLEANSFLLDRHATRSVLGEVRNSTVEGRVVVEQGAVVENSTIRGPSFVGRGTTVRNSFVGPFTSIGEDCVVEGSEVEHSVILDQVTLRGVSLMDSLVGTRAVVERGAKRQRLVIGENSRVWM